MTTGPAAVEVLVGVDVGKTTHHATAIDAAGTVLFDRPVRNEQSSLEALLDAAGAHGVPALVIDQPGSIAALALAVARDHGVAIAYIPGLVMRRAADLYPGEAKTDTRDSYVLANTARVHRQRIAWLTADDELLERLRVLSGYDDDLAADVVRVANRLRDTLTTLNPALERVLGRRLGHPAVRALLARYPTPTTVREAGPARLVRLLTRHAPRMGVRLADEVLAAAVASQTVTVPAAQTHGRVVADLAGELDRLHARRDQLAADLEDAFLAHPLGPVLVTLPSVGPRTGAKILAELGDGSVFDTGSQLAGYAGLARVTCQSVSSIRGETQSRRGNHGLTNAMFLAASDSTRSPAWKAFSDRTRAEGDRGPGADFTLHVSPPTAERGLIALPSHHDQRAPAALTRHPSPTPSTCHHEGRGYTYKCAADFQSPFDSIAWASQCSLT